MFPVLGLLSLLHLNHTCLLNFIVVVAAAPFLLLQYFDLSHTVAVDGGPATTKVRPEQVYQDGENDCNKENSQCMLLFAALLGHS